jgi:hypothetical protein
MAESEEEMKNRFRILETLEDLLNEWPWSGIEKHNVEAIKSRREELYNGIWSLLSECSKAGVRTADPPDEIQVLVIPLRRSRGVVGSKERVQGDRMNKKLWVIKEEDDYFLIYEEEESHKIKDNYDDRGLVVSVIPLPDNAVEGWNPDAFEGLMLLDDVNCLLLLLMDFVYRAGRRDQQAETQRFISEE